MLSYKDISIIAHVSSLKLDNLCRIINSGLRFGLIRNNFDYKRKKNPRTISMSLEFDTGEIMCARSGIKMCVEQRVHQCGFTNTRLS